MTDILECLEFNAKHSGDVVARRYFDLAAIEIRSLRSKVISLEGHLTASRIDIRGLEGSLARLIVQVYEAPQSPTNRKG